MDKFYLKKNIISWRPFSCRKGQRVAVGMIYIIYIILLEVVAQMYLEGSDYCLELELLTDNGGGRVIVGT